MSQQFFLQSQGASSQDVRALIEGRLGLRKSFTRLQPGAIAQLQKDFERELVAFVVERCDGNQVRASAVLQINRNTLRKRLLQHELPNPAEVRRAHNRDEWLGLREQRELARPQVMVADPADWVTIEEAAILRMVKPSTARCYMCEECWNRQVVAGVLMVSKRDVVAKGGAR